MAKNEQDLIWVYNPTKAPFTVKYGGFPYTLQSAEKKILPRFIAEHFAKHLADAILMRREQKEEEEKGKPVSYMNHPIERPKVVNMIILEVYSQFQEEAAAPGDQIGAMVDQINKGADAANAPVAPTEKAGFYEDFGLVPDKAMGTLKAPADPIPAVPGPSGEVEDNDGSLLSDSEQPPVVGLENQPKRSRDELITEAQKLGLEFDPKVSTVRLEQMIKNF